METTIKANKKTKLYLAIGLVCVFLLLSSCSPCNEQAAIKEWKESAWWGLLNPDTIWFPPEDEMNITSKGAISGEYFCNFVAYGKRGGTYRGFKVEMGLKCTPQGMIGVDYASNLANSYGWEETDSTTIERLEKTPPSSFTHEKKSWER